MQQTNAVEKLPSWLYKETKALLQDIITLLPEEHADLLAIILYGSVARHEERPLDAFNPSDVDLLAIFDSDDPLLAIHRGDALSHTLSMAYGCHLDVPRE